MFEKLIDAILSLVAELKRFNDANSPSVKPAVKTTEKTTEKAVEVVTKEPAEKAAPKAEKPAPKAKQKEVSVADVQALASQYITSNSRDAFIKLLGSLGYKNISGAFESDGATGLLAIQAALNDELASDPAA
jgi:hypothetical protein